MIIGPGIWSIEVAADEPLCDGEHHRFWKRRVALPEGRVMAIFDVVGVDRLFWRGPGVPQWRLSLDQYGELVEHARGLA